MKKVKTILMIISLVISGFLMAQNQDEGFEIDAQLRFRGELDHGYKNLPDENSHLVGVISQRTRLAAQYHKDFFSTRISLQHVMMWGDESIASKTGVWSDSLGVNINEAWVKLKLFSNATITLGRQYFKYDDQRLIAWRNWNQFSLSYDAVKFSYLKDAWQLDLGLSWNNKFDKLFGKEFGTNNYYDNGFRMKSFNFMYLKRDFGESYVSFTAIASGYQEVGTSNTFKFKYTYGPYISLKFNNVDFILNGFLQSGRDAYNREVAAYMFSANAGYKLHPVKLGMGIDYISGNDDENPDNINHNFDLLYGARFKFYGWMNRFGYIPGSTYGGGLVDIYPNITFNFNKKNNLKIYYHLFSLQANVQKPVVEKEFFDKNLGSELDLMYSLQLKKEISINLGASYYFTTPTIEYFASGSNYGKQVSSSEPYWFWVMLTAKPVFFKSNKN